MEVDVRGKVEQAVPKPLDLTGKGLFARGELREIGVTPEQTELTGVAGRIDGALRGIGGIFGKDRVGKRFEDFDGAIKKADKAGLAEKYAAIEVDVTGRAERLAMGTETGKKVVESLIGSSEKSSEGLVKGVKAEVADAIGETTQKIAADAALTDKLSREVRGHKAKMMGLLDKMWEHQDQRDKVAAALIDARSADENDAEGWKLKRSGGLLRRTWAKVGGVIPGAQERLSAMTKGPQETRADKVNTTLGGTEGYIRGVASAEELTRLEAGGVFDRTKSKVERLEKMGEFLVARDRATTESFRDAREAWADGVMQTLETGFGPDWGLTREAVKAGLTAGDIMVGTIEAADGTSRVVFESAESMVAKMALEKLQSVMAAREMVAGSLKQAVQSGGGVGMAEAAKQMKGADQVAARAILRAARTESAIAGAGKGLKEFGAAAGAEAIDEITGGVTKNETVRSLLKELTKREMRIGVEIEGVAASSESKDRVDGMLIEVFAKVPDNYLTRNSWEDFLRKTPFKIGEKAASLLDWVNSGFGLDAKSSLVKALVDGSRRRFADEVLGVKVDRRDGGIVIDQRAAGLYRNPYSTLNRNP